MDLKPSLNKIMSLTKINFIFIILLLFSLGAVPSATAGPEPLSPNEEQLLKEMEEKKGAEDVQSGDYNPVSHWLNTTLQVGAILVGLGLAGFTIYYGIRRLGKKRVVTSASRDKRKWERLDLEQIELSGHLLPKSEQADEYLYKLLNISQAGAGLELQQQADLSPGDEVKIKPGDEKSLYLGELTGIIRWSAGKKIGVQFDCLLDYSFNTLNSIFCSPTMVRGS